MAELIGARVFTDWIRAHPEAQIYDKVVLQSSDSEFHCITIDGHDEVAWSKNRRGELRVDP